jgi:hypothetical protein
MGRKGARLSEGEIGAKNMERIGNSFKKKQIETF